MSNLKLQKKAAEANEYWLCPKTGIEMAVIPAGRFFYGAQCGIPLVTGSYSMGRYPVTNAQWADFVKDSGYEPDAGHPRPETYLQHWSNQKTPPKAELEHPVTWVSYIDALYFVKWAGLELPSEWWWEKAARGTEGRAYPWGDAYSRWRPQLNFAHIDQQETIQVDAFANIQTAFGCEQMVGNVSEFCLSVEDLDQSRFESSSGLHVVTPDPYQVAVEELIALRGTCYLRVAAKPCSHRRRLSAGRRNNWTGFRVAWSEQV